MAKILVVDDEMNIREILGRILGGAGHDVVSVEDGLYTKQAIDEYKPDLVICDINMPGLNGDELIESLKMDPKYRKTKIMILTALGEQARWIQNQVSADAFMAKPFESKVLIQKVEELLKKNRVRIGSRKLNGSGRQTWQNRVPLFIVVLSVGAIIFLAVTFIYNQLYITPLLSKPDPKDVFNTGFLADKMFIYAIPVFLGVIGYVVYLLSKIASKKN